MADNINDLQTDDDSELTDEERDFVETHVGSGNTSGKQGKLSPKVEELISNEKIKLLCYLVIVFVIIANPWTQNYIYNVDYFGGNKMTIMIVSTMLFIVVGIALIIFV